MAFTLASGKASLQQGVLYSLVLPEGTVIPITLSDLPLALANESVWVRNNQDLQVLGRLGDYPHVLNLLDGDKLCAYLNARKALFSEWLKEGIYIFGAYKVGVYVAREAARQGVRIKGFIDNDPGRNGTRLEGAEVFSPDRVDLRSAVVVVASGQHGNAILAQLSGVCEKVLNMSEFLYAADAGHGPEAYFAEVVHQPIREAYRYLSIFLRLADETSRQVFNSLIGMRTTLSICSALESKSPASNEYFDSAFVSAEQARYFVDAGAFTGDTLASLERHFGPVEQAYLFEPELPAYYEALKRFSDRENVWVFNMGLDAQPSRSSYSPELSCNVLGEIEGPVSATATSYIQGVPLDRLVHGKVGLFKLDIEGMEERALQGAAAVIKRERPVLAVCAYHRADDYWKLIDAVTAIRPDYRIGLRHYADILHDITLYFY